MSLSASVVAQPATASSATNTDDSSIKLDRFVVTGSLIPIAADTPAIPITVIGSAEIDESGVTTDVLEVIKKTQPNFYGNNNLGSDNGNISSGETNGGSTASLRNRATLILINGRRAAVNGVAASGGRNFVDLSLIPLAAVERIEILSDGASATYGSDAVSGVINVILKTNFQGAEIGGTYGWSPNEGNWANRKYHAVTGVSNGKTSVTLSTEWKKSDPLIQRERSFGRGQFRSPTFAGSINIAQTTNFYYLNPSLNAPPQGLNLTPAELVAQGIYQGPLTQSQVSQFFDLASYPTMLIGAERRSFVAAIEHRLTDTTSLFGDFIHSVNDTESILNAQPVGGNVSASNANNPFDVTITARNRFVTFPRIYQTETTSTRGVVGVRGQINARWSYELAGDFNRVLSSYRNHNLIDADAYSAAVTNGTYNPFARVQAPGVVEGFLGSSFRDYTSELVSFDLRVSGELIDLPAGPLQVGFGAETRWESLSFQNDRHDQTGKWLQATPRQPFAAKFTTDGFFAEARIPVFGKANEIRGGRLLEFSIAGRKDLYSNTSDPFVPKYSVRWMPFNDELAIRGTYSESFSAPTLFELLGPVTAGFTPSVNITRHDTSGNSLGIDTGFRQYRSSSGSNPALNPSESRNWTVGVVWSPTKNKALRGFTISADWFNVDERDLVSTVEASILVADVERLGPASQFASRVRLAPSIAGETHFETGAPVTSPGQMTNRPSDEVWITNRYVNLAGVWQSGLDVHMSYFHEMKGWGRINFDITGVYLHEYFVQNFPGEEAVNYTDSYHSIHGTQPRFRTFANINWNHKNINVGISHTHIPGIDDVKWTTPYETDDFNSFDLRASYDFSGAGVKWLEGLQMTVGMNNAFNELPPLIRSEGNQSHDIRTYDAIGRFVYVSAKYKF